MKEKLYNPGWRIVFAVGFLAFISSFILKVMRIEHPQFITTLLYVIGYSAVVFGLVQVLLSTIIRTGEKVTWVIPLLFLAPLGLLLYFIVYKRIHGFYRHPSKLNSAI